MTVKRTGKRLFYLDGELYRLLRVNRPTNTAIAWSYSERKTVSFLWTHLRKNKERAYTIIEVADMMGRHPIALGKFIREGWIKPPQRAYSLEPDGDPSKAKYMFSKADIYALHDAMLSVHIGRPRKDGQITPARMPSRVELRAMLEHDTVMYVKAKDGSFVPVWKENNTW